MADPIIQPSPGNTEAALVRLEGKIDRLIDGLSRHADDMKIIRERQHEHANLLTEITTLNPKEKFEHINDRIASHDHRLQTVETDMQQRRGAMNVIRALWALVALVAGAAVTAIIKMIWG